MSRPLKAALHSNKERKENALQLNDRTLLPFEDSDVPFSTYVPHNKLQNHTPNRCLPMSPNTSKPTRKQLNHHHVQEIPNKQQKEVYCHTSPCLRKPL